MFWNVEFHDHHLATCGDVATGDFNLAEAIPYLDTNIYIYISSSPFFLLLSWLPPRAVDRCFWWVVSNVSACSEPCLTSGSGDTNWLFILIDILPYMPEINFSPFLPSFGHFHLQFRSSAMGDSSLKLFSYKYDVQHGVDIWIWSGDIQERIYFRLQKGIRGCLTEGAKVGRTCGSREKDEKWIGYIIFFGKSGTKET
jgi:hypothetical protein